MDFVTEISFCIKARLHKRFLSRQLDAIFVALELQLQNHTCKLGAISVRFVAAISHGVSNMFETCCNFSATKIASSCRDKNRLCKRALKTPVVHEKRLVFRGWKSAREII